MQSKIYKVLFSSSFLDQVLYDYFFNNLIYIHIEIKNIGKIKKNLYISKRHNKC
jgi:hypothetical protein